MKRPAQAYLLYESLITPRIPTTWIEWRTEAKEDTDPSTASR
jgi:hypothetical protein